MFPNFPLLKCQTKWNRDPVLWRANMHFFSDHDEKGTSNHSPPGYPIGREFDPDEEKFYQKKWIKEILVSYRTLMANPEADVICVRGNHDFTDLYDAFRMPGCSTCEMGIWCSNHRTWEVGLDPTRTTEILGLKVGGCRGIPYIVGEWSDELSEREKAPEGHPVRPPVGRFEEVAQLIPGDLELLVTHAPPYGILDAEGNHYGSRSLNNYVMERMYAIGRLRAHFFGHVHDAHGSRTEAGILFSNAARTHIVYDL